MRFQASYGCRLTPFSLAGADVNLRIQGVRAQCTVAHLGEASKLGSQFMTSGSLTFYFDSKLNAPVLYGEYIPALRTLLMLYTLVGDDGKERPTNIPRTIMAPLMQRRKSWRDSVNSLLGLLKHPESEPAGSAVHA